MQHLMDLRHPVQHAMRCLKDIVVPDHQLTEIQVTYPWQHYLKIRLCNLIAIFLTPKSFLENLCTAIYCAAKGVMGYRLHGSRLLQLSDRPWLLEPLQCFALTSCKRTCHLPTWLCVYMLTVQFISFKLLSNVDIRTISVCKTDRYQPREF